MATKHEVRFIQFDDGRLLPQQMRETRGGRWEWVACDVFHVKALEDSEAEEAWGQIDMNDLNSGRLGEKL